MSSAGVTTRTLCRIVTVNGVKIHRDCVLRRRPTFSKLKVTPLNTWSRSLCTTRLLRSDKDDEKPPSHSGSKPPPDGQPTSSETDLNVPSEVESNRLEIETASKHEKNVKEKMYHGFLNSEIAGYGRTMHQDKADENTLDREEKDSEAVEPSTDVFIGKLPLETNSEGLKELLQGVNYDGFILENNWQQRFAVVHCRDLEDANGLIEKLQGQNLKVKFHEKRLKKTSSSENTPDREEKDSEAVKPSTDVFIGKLPLETDSEGLKELLQGVNYDGYKLKKMLGKRFAVVHCKDLEDAKGLIEKLQGQDLNVRFDKKSQKKTSSSENTPDREEKDSEAVKPSTDVFIGNLPLETDSEGLKELLQGVNYDGYKLKEMFGQRFAVVHCRDLEDANGLIEKLQGQNLKVKFHEKRLKKTSSSENTPDREEKDREAVKPSTDVFIGKLPLETNSEGLKELLQGVNYDGYKLKKMLGQRFAVVHCKDLEDAKGLIEKLQGQNLKVKFHEKRLKKTSSSVHKAEITDQADETKVMVDKKEVDFSEKEKRAKWKKDTADMLVSKKDFNSSANNIRKKFNESEQKKGRDNFLEFQKKIFPVARAERNDRFWNDPRDTSQPTKSDKGFEMDNPKLKALRKKLESDISDRHKDAAPVKVLPIEEIINGKGFGVFTKEDYVNPTESVQTLFDVVAQEEFDKAYKQDPFSAFEEEIQWTKEGKLWHFPIDNEQGWEEEKQYSFQDHIFFDEQLKEFPKTGPVRHFMELVTIALASNHHLTVPEKHETIEWYKQYFLKHGELLAEKFGEEGTVKIKTDKKSTETEL